jgi:D-arabinose 1-dehydrogenase-like Zn-dependent alcohol dehydrogenase/uncharacterized protein (UPF0276 family)
VTEGGRVASAPAVGVNLGPTEDLREAILPLLEDGEIDALEWSVDMGFHGVPDWADALLTHFGDAGRLLAHGVELSLLTAGHEERRAIWMAGLDAAVKRHRFQHLTEHLGLMTAGELVRGTPFPHPFTRTAVAIGRARLAELRDRSGVSVGLENLALAFSARDVDAQPDFLEALLAPDGHLLLDLHNLLCQAETFGRDPIALLHRYPLARVREVHLAGGTYFRAKSGGAPIRRDDHEGEVPEACFALLDEALAHCPALRWVILEHADGMLRSEAQLDAFRASFRRARAQVLAAATRSAVPIDPGLATTPRAPEDLGDVSTTAAAQVALLETLDEAETVDDARTRLRAHAALDVWRPWVDAIEPRALELAITLVARWGERAPAQRSPNRVAVLHAPHVLRFEDAPIPEPGLGEVRLRVEACGVCGTDVHFFEGRLTPGRALVLGHETIGVVEAHGPGVDAPAIGTRVGVPWAQRGCGRCDACARGRWRSCARLETWMTLGGGHARHVRAVASACVPIPDALSSITAAPLFCAGHTAASAIARAKLEAGERIAIAGIGGLGHLALQLASELAEQLGDCDVWAMTRTPSKRRDALALGAHEVLAGDDPAGALAKRGGADVVIATLSSPHAIAALLPALRPGGRLVVAGLADGAIALDPLALLNLGATVIGAAPGPTADLEHVLALAARGRVRPIVERYGRGQLRTALLRVGEGRIRYRAVVSADS